MALRRSADTLCKLPRQAARHGKRTQALGDRYIFIRSFFSQHQTNPGILNGYTSLRNTSDAYDRPLCLTRSRPLHVTALSRAEKTPQDGQKKHQDDVAKANEKPPPPQPPPNFDNYSQFFKRLAMSLPHVPRPTRDDFLNVTQGFWQRLKIRFKWFTIRSFRNFNTDDMSAFITWFIFSQTVWILVGTTTFFSVIFATANSLRLQHYIARAISDYLTSETGVVIVFESAIVPKWKNSQLSFKNVYISRKPSNVHLARCLDDHTAAAGYDVSNHPSYHYNSGEEEDATHELIEDLNYAMFDLNIDSVDVNLSLYRWLDGKGLVKDAVVRGVRGILDRRSVSYDPEHPLVPADFLHASQPGDFELDSLQLEDVLVTVYQPDEFRPYTASVFRADVHTFRKRWMLYDFLSAENIVGQIDNCLFSLHKPQSIGRSTESDLRDGEWSRMSRIRIDGVNIDHIQRTTTDEGPLSWITSGKVDAVFDIKFPRDVDASLHLNEIIGDIADAISTSISTRTADPLLARIPGQRELAKPPLWAPEDEELAQGQDGAGESGREGGEEEQKKRRQKLVIDVDLRFRDIKAAVPMFARDLSYVNNALIRPIVAFMNANRTLIPIRCRVVKDLSDFDGAWTLWETGTMDDLSLKVYEALALHITQSNNLSSKRIKTVSLWSLQMTAQAVLNALRAAMNPISMTLREAGSLKGSMPVTIS